MDKDGGWGYLYEKESDDVLMDQLIQRIRQFNYNTHKYQYIYNAIDNVFLLPYFVKYQSRLITSDEFQELQFYFQQIVKLYHDLAASFDSAIITQSNFPEHRQRLEQISRNIMLENAACYHIDVLIQPGSFRQMLGQSMVLLSMLTVNYELDIIAHEIIETHDGDLTQIDPSPTNSPVHHADPVQDRDMDLVQGHDMDLVQDHGHEMGRDHIGVGMLEVPVGLSWRMKLRNVMRRLRLRLGRKYRVQHYHEVDS